MGLPGCAHLLGGQVPRKGDHLQEYDFKETDKIVVDLAWCLLPTTNVKHNRFNESQNCSEHILNISQKPFTNLKQSSKHLPKISGESFEIFRTGVHRDQTTHRKGQTRKTTENKKHQGNIRKTLLPQNLPNISQK